MVASILLPGLAVLLLGVGLIYSSLMILIRSKMLYRLMYSMLITSGILLVLVSVFSRAAL
jgi:hypothetical membrane protein